MLAALQDWYSVLVCHSMTRPRPDSARPCIWEIGTEPNHTDSLTGGVSVPILSCIVCTFGLTPVTFCTAVYTESMQKQTGPSTRADFVVDRLECAEVCTAFCTVGVQK